MRRGPRTSQPAPRDYTFEIDLLSHQLAVLTRRWNGVAPTPPSLAEAVGELTTTMEELHSGERGFNPEPTGWVRHPAALPGIV